MKPNAKAQLFTQVLPRLMESSPYVTHKAIQTAVTAAGVAIEGNVLNVYLSEAVKQGIIHSAGRGWYSRLSQPVKLDKKPVRKLIRCVEKAFPLLDFTVWSTAQLNPWMHHMVARPVAFLSASRDALHSIRDSLKVAGWDVAVNPGKMQVAQQLMPDERMVVLRPLHSKQPPPSGHQASVEQVLVDLKMENDRLALMGNQEGLLL